MAKKELFPSWSATFDIEADEESIAFFKRMQRERKDIEEAAKERIKQLFKEHVALEGEAKIMASKLLDLFAIGYQLGWNDCHALRKETENN
jgi:hypothetical protein